MHYRSAYDFLSKGGQVQFENFRKSAKAVADTDIDVQLQGVAAANVKLNLLAYMIHLIEAQIGSSGRDPIPW
eukprot:CAMPEP_0115007794 /NCGR_PEP_ID=MMETSP0216-20121206/21453_1 /TAXON_ID=223996 /ORGANISM="Protocruzia adherens, Strain Boccale" /LENGTH=71 /DNA_ID=CAMNT_0002374927 /DNA_START=260 /DNA_END=472 /DNA_ORIENTATION=-